jgi:hypothetical protein
LAPKAAEAPESVKDENTEESDTSPKLHSLAEATPIPDPSPVENMAPVDPPPPASDPQNGFVPPLQFVSIVAAVSVVLVAVFVARSHLGKTRR